MARRSPSCFICEEAKRRGWTRRSSLYGKTAVIPEPFGQSFLIYFRIGHDCQLPSSMSASTLRSALGLPDVWSGVLQTYFSLEDACRAVRAPATPVPSNQVRHGVWFCIGPALDWDYRLLYGGVYSGSEFTEQIADTAMKMVGFFFGKEIEIDRSAFPDKGRYRLGANPWRPPIAYPDGCELCRKLTDAEVERRVAAYDAAMQKEVARINRGEKTTADFPQWPIDGWYDRQKQLAWQAAADEYYRRTDKILFDLRLSDLPMEYRRTLCVLWNHQWLDWLAQMRKEDPERAELVHHFLIAPPVQGPEHPAARWRWMSSKLMERIGGGFVIGHDS